MKTSVRGIDLIKKYESYQGRPYLCPAGFATIGYGHRIKPFEEYPNGLSEADAEKLLMQDLERYEAHILRNVEAEINQDMFDALVSFTYNCGTGAFDKSTLRFKLNKGDYDGCADEFPRWNRAGSKVLAGLHKRRLEEQQMFIEGIEKMS